MTRVRLPEAEELCNFRDLGGLPIDGRGVVRSGVLYRSAAPMAGDEPPAGVPWPPRTVVDLRSPRERPQPHPLALGATQVVWVPLFSSADPAKQLRREPGSKVELVELLSAMVIDRQEHVVRAVESIADSTGPCLVHCVAGKDRTGVVIAAVLAAVGVPDRAIVDDFVRTNDNLDAILKRIAQARPDLPADAFAEVPLSLLQAPAEAIAVVLDILASHPGGAAGWLVDQGLSASRLARLRDRLTE